MIIKNIKLVNFRSHKEYSLGCEKLTTLILGENGSGKTSILEAIYMIFTGNSFKSIDNEILKKGEEYFLVELEYFDGKKISVSYDGVKKFLIKDKKYKRLPKTERYPVVLFKPDDLNLITAGKTEKRSYFDKFFSQLSEEYYNNLLRYNKVLRQRNNLLKNKDVKGEDLFGWNILIVKYGMFLEKIRLEKIEEINKEISKKYLDISDIDDNIRIDFLYNNFSAKEYLQKLEENFLIDKLSGRTNFGAHRNNYEFKFNNSLAGDRASRGESRSLVLALKFIEAKMLENEAERVPVVLLDDVMSELDEKRREALKKNFSKNQIIMTSVS